MLSRTATKKRRQNQQIVGSNSGTVHFISQNEVASQSRDNLGGSFFPLTKYFQMSLFESLGNVPILQFDSVERRRELYFIFWPTGEPLVYLRTEWTKAYSRVTIEVPPLQCNIAILQLKMHKEAAGHLMPLCRKFELSRLQHDTRRIIIENIQRSG